MDCCDKIRRPIACLIVAFAGCQSSESIEPLAEPPAVDLASPQTDEMADTDRAVAATDAATRTTGETSEDSVVAEFSPPFPNRTELFEPPKRAAGSVRHDEEHGETVELKGFITVDKPRAVLSIDGVVSPIAEGGEKYGVQVITIQPPSVVLQRGRNRWTATLE